VPSPSRSSSSVLGRKVAIGVLVVAVALGLITAATVFGKSSGPKLSTSSAQAQWQYAAHLLNRRSYTASALIGRKIYVAAGMVGNSGRPLNLFEAYDSAKNEWSSLPLVPEKFSAAAGVSLGSTLYVIGGNGDAKDKAVDGRQVFAYDTVTKRWSRKASLPVPRTNLAAVALNGEIYALGGLDPFFAVKSVYIYNPKRNDWRPGPPLPEKLHAHAAVAFRGEIWVIGGQSKLGVKVNHLWIYNPHLHKWRKGPSMPVPLETAGAAVYRDEIHVVLEKTYLVWHASTRRWTRGPGLRTPRHALAVYVIGHELYAIGGCISPILEDSAIVERIALD
jgi:N-acetylneuraminic acid mutarotase